MKHPVRNILVTALSVAALASQSYAGANLVSGPIALGVNDEGHLNFSDGITFSSNAGSGGAVGIAISDPAGGGYLDATSPGCLCEGWGASANGVSGYASIDSGGVVNLSVDSFVATATSITSATTVGGLGLSVSQVYTAAPAAPTKIFQNTVTLTNNSLVTMTDVRYARAMDWDVPPSEFSEYVTIAGTATTALLETSHDNGFSSPDPLTPSSPLDPATLDVDFVDNGTSDHGAYFLFNFGTLDPGESVEFKIFYGASYSEADALAALGAVGAELYSLGQSSGDPAGGTPYTYSFGFKGVGGVVILPDPTVPEPSVIGLLGFGLIALTLGMRRRR